MVHVRPGQYPLLGRYPQGNPNIPNFGPLKNYISKVVSRSVTRQLELKITDRRQLSKNVNAMVENCFSDCLFSRETFVSLMYTAILNRLKLQSFKVDYTRKIAKTQHIWPEASWQKPPRP